MDFQKIIVVGRLGHDPEMRFTADGTAVTKFRIACHDGFGEHEKTLWFRVSTWRKLAETCNQYLKKGQEVLVEGRLTGDETGNPRMWTGNDGVARTSFEIEAKDVRFGSKPSTSTISASIPEPPTAEGTPEQPPFVGPPVPEEDIPF